MRRHLFLGSALLAILSDASAHAFNRRNVTNVVASSTSSLSSMSSLTIADVSSSSSSSSSTGFSSSSASLSSSASAFTSSSRSSSSMSTSLSQSSSLSLSSSTSSSSPSSSSSSSSTVSQSTGSSSSSLGSSSTSTSSGSSSTSRSSTTGSPTLSITTNSTSINSSSASNSSSLITTNSSIITTTLCTGCILEALDPSTLTLTTEGTTWSAIPSITITQTVVFYVTTFSDRPPITSTVFENVTETGAIPANLTSLPTAPMYGWSPPDQPDITLTLESGAIYVALTDLWGGEEMQPTPTATPATQEMHSIFGPPSTCHAFTTPIPIRPTDAAQWSSFIQTLREDESLGLAVPLPGTLVDFLQQNPAISSYFPDDDIRTCTARIRTTPKFTLPQPTSTPSAPSAPPPESTTAFETVTSFPFESGTVTETETETGTQVGGPSPTTSNFLSVTTTSKYVTKDGNLRTDTGGAPIAPSINTPTVNPPINSPINTPKPPVQPESQGHENQSKGDPVVPTPGIPDIIASIINNPAFSKPGDNQNNKPSDNPGSITVGNTVLPIRPAQPTNPDQNGQSVQNPGIVVGSQTLTPGQATQINGVFVSVPTNGGGSSIVVGGSTVAVNPVAPTGPAVLTVGDNTVTANPQGQFVIGSQTLTPGGPAITVGGSTISLGPSGTIGVVNGVTQTLGNAPVITAAPVLTIGHQTIPATVVGGSTMFVLGPGQTLTPGGSIVFDGSTFSMPTGGSGSTVVINGVTQTLNNPSALPVLTFGGQSLTASVVDGTTEFIVGQGQTLTPGGSIVVSGTTYSMPTGGSGSTIIVNGVTQTLNNPSGLPVLTLGGQSLTATVIGGTTEFIVGDGQTLTPGGVLTVSGTTFSMPASASGSVIVVNGVTSTLGQGPITAYPALTIDGKTYSATIRDGTTEYVLGPGTTLKPGEQITISGTTYSLDDQGTALIINGKTSSIPTTPASNSASTTGSGSQSQSTSGSSGSLSRSSRSSLSSSTTSKQRDPGNFIASGIGITSKKGDAVAITGGLDKWAEGMLIGLAGWLLMFL